MHRDGEIVLLDNLTIDRIAAGEVIERPASVVKELLENALDAGSRRIRVRLEGGGLDWISVDDDGRGMIRSDLHRCWLRHATSKLRQAEDLHTIATHGFRGEALSSIASVAEMRIESRRSGSPDAWAVELRNGELLSEIPGVRPAGTVVEVRDLFAGLPVRRRFLGTPTAEAQRVLGAVLRHALCRPDVEFRLQSGGRELLHALPETRDQRVRRLLGRLAEGLLPVTWTDGTTSVAGFVGAPGTDRGRPDQIFLSINRRPIQGGVVSRAVARGLGLPPGRFPIAVLDIALPLDQVDVNVHPQKREVRFLSESPVFHAVAEAVARALDLAGGIPLLFSDAEALGGSPAADASRPSTAPRLGEPFTGGLSSRHSDHDGHSAKDIWNASREELAGFPAGSPAASARGERESPPFHDSAALSSQPGGGSPAPMNPELSRSQSFPPLLSPSDLVFAAEPGAADSSATQEELFPRPNIVAFPAASSSDSASKSMLEDSPSPRGTIPFLQSAGILVCALQDGFLCIDQRAAHERVLYEQALAGLDRSGAIPCQQLLFPKPLDLPVREFNAAIGALEQLRALSFDLEPFGGNGLLLRGVPASVTESEAERVLSELLAAIAEEDPSRDRLNAACAAAFASGAAIRRDKELSPSERNRLVEDLFACADPWHGPSGRPTTARVSGEELMRMFR